jgi:hypothetical protein
MRRIAVAVPLVGAVFCAMMLSADADEIVKAVTIQGRGELTICRSWFVYTSCATHKVQLPESVAVGDLVQLSYGSNTKTHNFRISMIRRQGDGCVMLSDQSGAGENGERIKVGRCVIPSEPTPNAR